MTIINELTYREVAGIYQVSSTLYSSVTALKTFLWHLIMLLKGSNDMECTHMPQYGFVA